MTGLPPILFVFSEGEVLAEDAVEGCRRVGDSCDMHRIEHGTHAALNYHEFYPEAAEAFARTVTFITLVLPTTNTTNATATTTPATAPATPTTTPTVSAARQGEEENLPAIASQPGERLPAIALQPEEKLPAAPPVE